MVRPKIAEWRNTRVPSRSHRAGSLGSWLFVAVPIAPLLSHRQNYLLAPLLALCSENPTLHDAIWVSCAGAREVSRRHTPTTGVFGSPETFPSSPERASPSSSASPGILGSHHIYDAEIAYRTGTTPQRKRMGGVESLTRCARPKTATRNLILFSRFMSISFCILRCGSNLE